MRFRCPRCNSNQDFDRKERIDGDEIEVYIQCTKCRWKRTMSIGSREVQQLRDDIEMLRSAQIRGKPVEQTLRKRRERLAGLIKDGR